MINADWQSNFVRTEYRRGGTEFHFTTQVMMKVMQKDD
jgi:hypothetical protein